MLKIQPWAQRLEWDPRHYEEGDPRCTCTLCGEVIGTEDDDPRRLTHDEDCAGCRVCEIAIRLFRGEGKNCSVQRYHAECFAKVLAPSPALGPAEPDLQPS